MKKVLIIALLLLASKTASAQAFSNFSENQELKFNIGLFLATTSIELGYEYYLSEDTSLGVIMHFDGDKKDFNGGFGLGANFRAYFGYNPRSGPFAEAFGIYIKGDKTIDEDLDSITRAYSGLALGLGAGHKWVTRSERFSLELHGGFGRNITPERYQDDFMFRAGINIGFRF